MALRIAFENDCGYTDSNAYIRICGLHFNYMTQKGLLEIGVWKDEQARRNGKKCHSTAAIPLSDTTLYQFGVVRQLKYSDLVDGGRKAAYINLKKHKILIGHQVTDLTKAEDC